MPRRYKIYGLLALFCFATAIPAQAAETTLDIFGDWGAYFTITNNNLKTCFAGSWSDAVTPTYIPKGRLTINASEPPDKYDGIVVTAGYQYDLTVTPQLIIDKKHYGLATNATLGNIAFVPPDLDRHRMVRELRVAQEPVTIIAKSNIGLWVTDVHNLNGFQEAYHRALVECGFIRPSTPNLSAEALQSHIPPAASQQQAAPQWPTPPSVREVQSASPSPSPSVQTPTIQTASRPTQSTAPQADTVVDRLAKWLGLPSDEILGAKLSQPTNPQRDAPIFVLAILLGGLFGYKHVLVRNRLIFIFVVVPIFCCWSFAAFTFFEWILLGGIPIRDVLAPIILTPLLEPSITRLWLVSCLMFLLASFITPAIAKLAANNRETIRAIFPKTEAKPQPTPHQPDPVETTDDTAREPEPVAKAQSLPALVEATPVEEVLPPSQPMLLRLKRSQRQGPMGGNIYMLDARLDVSAEIRDLITKHRWGNRVIYESEARQKHAQRTQDHLEGTKSDVGLFAPPKEQAMGAAKSIWKLGRAAVSAARMALSLRVTVNSILAGVHVECKSMEELLEAEDSFRKAKETLEGYVAAAQSFDGREVVA